MGAVVLDYSVRVGRGHHKHRDSARMEYMGEGRFDALVQCMRGQQAVVLMRHIFSASVDAFLHVVESLSRYVTQTMVPLAGALLLASCVPLDAGYFLGNTGEVTLAPLVLFVASGCIVLSWRILCGVVWGILNAASIFGR
jgi:hypothetical protein